MKSLYELYCQAWGRGLERTVSSHLFQELVHSWTEPHRVYHSLNHHLIPMITNIQHAKHNEHKSTLYLAAFYHDVVSQPMQADTLNVQESVKIFWVHVGQIQRSGVLDPRFLDEVTQEIQNTDYSDFDWEPSTFTDYDLHGLALPYEDYCTLGSMVRQEYPGIPDSQFTEGRSRFLVEMLERDNLFTHQRYQSEQQARANMSRELQEIRSSYPGCLMSIPEPRDLRRTSNG